ncbi:hypothetical protein BD410DRAFT_773366 [Rickenella mellea]|uniref:F-box domain-containing protein n=1 Tax=Rickenella mellea TaxID=50990 RepID=A0A4Y7PWZ3_9AGAM|nr:hypothetical protein BD410DRAFT_773366 [Rickenella mellea]
MSKRSPSPSPQRSVKRRHTSEFDNGQHWINSANFDESLSDELILVIFSYLTWVDLCVIQSTNRNWGRLATDNQLWKDLYLGQYGRGRLRGSRGFLGRRDGKEVKPLPGPSRHFRPPSVDFRNWKWMFRISLNWQRGRCCIENLTSDGAGPLSQSGVVAKIPIVLAGSLTITTSSNLSTSPSIFLYRPSTAPHTIQESYVTKYPTRLTTLTLDQSRPTDKEHEVRLAAFYETGEFAVFLIDHQAPSTSRRLYTYVPTSKTPRTSPITQAVYHHPLLITLSKTFHLSIYNVSEDRVVHSQTLTSFTSFPPTSLVLSATSITSFKLVLAYAVPVYPAHWSVAVTELTISSASPSTPFAVKSTRSTRASDFPSGWVDEASVQSVREQWSRKVGRVADTQTDGKWVVLAPAEGANTLQLYRLHLPNTSNANASPRLTFVRALHGHTGLVSSLALADGRCVSFGADGSLWVWDLEKGWSTEVQKAYKPADPSVLGTVVFDERRIISADSRGMEVRRFDI